MNEKKKRFLQPLGLRALPLSSVKTLQQPERLVGKKQLANDECGRNWQFSVRYLISLDFLLKFVSSHLD